MTISTLIAEESDRFYACYNHKPDHVFLGRTEVAEIDAMVEELKKWGMVIQGNPVPRATFYGMRVFRVDADSHLSFGLEQPSPCG